MFNTFKLVVQRQFVEMQKNAIYTVELNKDLLWETYLKSFPEGTNPVYKTRSEHDCQCCKQFIRNIGNIVIIQGDKLVTLWDISIDNFYQDVANAMAQFVKSHIIDNIFLHTEKNIGIDKNHKLTDTGVITYNHFHIQLPPLLVVSKDIIGSRLADIRTNKEVMRRSLDDITLEAIDPVLELIDQNSLYRGEEHKFAVDAFRALKIKFEKATDKELFCWDRAIIGSPNIARMRNTVIGTLLCDLSENKDLEQAIASFEQKVAPTNYKRPTAIIAKGMIEKAKQQIEELGLLPTLNRRFAVMEDISINNVLFADRTARKKIDNIFDELSSQTPTNIKNLDKVEEISIEEFIINILPKITSMELMYENRHSNNLVSLIAPSDLTAKGIFKWPNPFSWSYNGEVTDSVKERVKKAGGKVDGDLRCSLSWFNYDDLDLHMMEPNGQHIYFGNKRSRTLGHLDVDMNAWGGPSRNAVENICYPNRNEMIEGTYQLRVNNYCKRETVDVGFEVEVEFDNKLYTYTYTRAVKDGESINVASINYSHKDGFKIIDSLPSTVKSKILWNIPTQTFQKVNLMLLSPNHWDGKIVGNKHYFFILEGCINDAQVRGFYNEFLSEEFNPHRKVFEVLASKMKPEFSENQLSGLGFSSTQRNSVLCKVTGSFTRILKLIF